MEDDYSYYGDEENDLAGELLPCEFCGEPFPAGIFIEHSTGCQIEQERHKTEDAELDCVPWILEESTNESIPPKPKRGGTEAAPQTRKSYTSVKLAIDDNRSAGGRKLTFGGNMFEDAAEQNFIRNQSSVSGIKRTSLLPKLNNSDAADMDKEKEVEEMDGKEYILSDDDDDAVESIESFWKRASMVLKKRLPEKYSSHSNANSDKYESTRKANTNAVNDSSAKSKFGLDWTW